MRVAGGVAAAFAMVLVSCDSDSTGPDPAPRLAALVTVDTVVETQRPVVLSVRATNAKGQAAGDVVIVWESTVGAGTLTQFASRTGPDGIASAILLPGLGENRVTARAPAWNVSIAFLAHGCSRCGQWSVEGFGMQRTWSNAIAVSGRVWVIGGMAPTLTGISTVNDVTIFDPSTGSWQNSTPLPRPLGAPVVVQLMGSIYAIGGSHDWVESSAGVLAYDPITGTWTQRASLAVPRAFAAGASLGGRIYIVAGRTDCDSETCQYTHTLEIYDPVANRWTGGPALSQSRDAAGAAVLHDKLYVAGGYRFDATTVLIESVEMFDPITNRWSARAPLPIGGPTQLVVANDTLFAFVSLVIGFSRVYQYDEDADDWTRLRDAPASIIGPAVAAHDGRIYVIGGHSGPHPFPSAGMSDAVYVLRR